MDKIRYSSSAASSRTLSRVSFFIPLVFALVFSSLAAEASELGGFVEVAGSARFGDERPRKPGYNLLETRLELKLSHYPAFIEKYDAEFFIKGEALGDGYDEKVYFSFREFNLSLSPAASVDLKLGRQVLTWGTGDLLFINDLFPKDYVSFFIGRSDEYLKLPSDALRVSLWSGPVSVDGVVSRFEPNNSLTGERVSFFDPLSGALAGEELDRHFKRPPGTARNLETSLRVFGTFSGVEGALYFFRGFYKEPRGVLDAASESFFYPKLEAYGTSLRGPLLGGIANFEAGYYDSKNDSDGTDPGIENSSVKYLIGYSRDLGGELQIGVQYLLEQMLDYGEYEATLPAGQSKRYELRHLLTVRLTKLLRAQTLRLSLFVFYSPSDEDTYLRPAVGYALSDRVNISAGANLFGGARDYTEFGQLDGNDNVYLRVRYGF